MLGFDANASLTGSYAYNHIVGFQSRPNITSSATTTDMIGFYSVPSHNGSGTLNNLYGLKILDDGGSGTITNQYGVYIKALARGTSNNYAIYTEPTAQSYFGGPIGLGRLSPTYKLEIDSSSDGRIAFKDGTNTSYLGVATNFDVWAAPNIHMRLGTNNTERMRITNAGKVGIGTSTPGTSLQVANGTATTTVAIGSAGSSKGGCLKIRDSDDAGWTYCVVLDGTMSCGIASCE